MKFQMKSRSLGRRIALLIALGLLPQTITSPLHLQAQKKTSSTATEVSLPQPPQDSILNFSCPRKGVATSGQPTPEGLEWIAKQGYKAILNFRTEQEEGANIKAEMELAQKLGLRYVHIPFTSATLDDEKVTLFLAALDDPQNHPVYIHCALANRVGAMWMIYLVVKDGYPLEKAREEAKKVGLTSPKLMEFAEGYLARHPAKPGSTSHP